MLLASFFSFSFLPWSKTMVTNSNICFTLAWVAFDASKMLDSRLIGFQYATVKHLLACLWCSFQMHFNFCIWQKGKPILQAVLCWLWRSESKQISLQVPLVPFARVTWQYGTSACTSLWTSLFFAGYSVNLRNLPCYVCCQYYWLYRCILYVIKRLLPQVCESIFFSI